MEDELIQEFLAESWENLGQLDREIVELEKNPGNKDLLASIFRTIHTIKGTCGFIGLTHLGAVAHSTENVLGQMRDGKLDVTADGVSLVLAGIDCIKSLLEALEKDGREPDVDNSALIQRLDQLAECGGQPQVQANTAPETPDESEVQCDEIPAGNDSKDEAREFGQGDTRQTLSSQSTAQSAAAGQDAGRKSISDLSIRVNVEVLDSLMNLVGELVLTRNQLLQMARGDEDSVYSGPVAHLNRVTTDLQDGVMKTRMQPIGNAWNKLPRLIRDLSREMGKPIDLQMSGEDTELDRTVLDAIRDPLTHIIRNSADHGIELPQLRKERGKPETGTIRLNAFHEGGHVIIEIEDDGAGINIDRVKQKAIQRNLISEADAAQLSDAEATNLVFEPGFSTAETVSSVSGRGVGMDVVRTQIAKIGGTVDLSSHAGRGTTLTIKIPLTLAIISALIVESGEQSFAIPQLGVIELVRLTQTDRQQIEMIHNRQVLRLRDRLLPLVRLDEALSLQTDDDASESGDVNIVVVQAGDERLGLVVTRVFDTEEIVVKPVGSLLKDLDLYQGTTILGDGRVIMILDIAGIAQQAGHQRTGSSASESTISDGNTGSELGEGDTSLLLFETGDERLMAVPLSLVSRLEEFTTEQIERAGDRLVVQYRGSLLPLLPVTGDVSSEPISDPQPIIVFAERGKTMGLMVKRILDIQDEQFAVSLQSNQQGILGTSVVNDRAVEIIDAQYYVLQADPDWFLTADDRPQSRVLVVDDSSFFRQLAKTALEIEGYTVVASGSVANAKTLIENSSPFDAIVSDLEIPDMNGWEFARWVRGRPEYASTPLIAISGHVGPEYETKSLESGFNRFLAKFDARELCAAIGLLAHQDRVVSGAIA